MFVVAPLSLTWFPEGESDGWRVSRLEVMNPTVDAKCFYAPLQKPELVVDMAYLSEKGITPNAVLRWAKNYGLLGFPEDDTVALREEFANFRARGQRRRDSVARFVESAGEIRTCLRAYEVATAGSGPLDLKALEASSRSLPRQVLRPWERRDGEERSWVLRVVGRMVQTRINEHCYPKLSHYPDGRFAMSYGFKNLLGAIWLQMAWLLSAEDVKRCKLPDCWRVIIFQPGEQPPSDAPKGKRGKYKTYLNKEFCNHNCAAKHSYRK